jgi:hypothetical protein
MPIMDKMDEVSLEFPKESTLPTPESDADPLEHEIRITDRRVAQLLLVLHEIDVCINGLEQFSEPQLSELVGEAILACGFTDPVEARFALATVLDAIEAPYRLNRDYS